MERRPEEWNLQNKHVFFIIYATLILVLKIAQPRGKIAPGTFKFILSLHFSEKISNLPPTPGVG